MNQREQFEEFITSKDGLGYDVSKTFVSITDFYKDNHTQELHDTWVAAQAALIPHMEVLLADIQTIIAFGLFTPSPKLQEAIDFIKSATEDAES